MLSFRIPLSQPRRRLAALAPGSLARGLLALALALALGLAGTSAHAAERAVPYWASIRAPQVNMHVGPSRSYGSSWVYKRQHLPLKVIRLKEGWRLVEDPDGTRGWMLAQFLSPERSALVTGPGHAEMRAQASAGAPSKWRLEPGVIGKLGDCVGGWCQLDLRDGHVGFVEQSRLWGAGEP